MDDERAREEKYARITSAPLYPLLWRMALPSMAGMMAASVYGMTDTYCVGKLGRADATAAVGVVFSFVSLIQAVGFWFGYGSGNYIARMVGQKRIKEAERMASVSFTLALGTGMAILAFGLLFLGPLAAALGGGASEGLLAAVVRYLRITLISVPLMLASNLLYNQLRLQGSAGDGMLGLFVGMLVNALLDPVFILLLRMDVAGAALASLTGQACGTALLFLRSSGNGNVRVRPFRAKPDPVSVKEILAGGAPNFCRQGITAISGVVLNLAAGGFGEAALAGVTIAQRLLSVGYALVIGFGQGFQPICLVNYGAGNRGRIKRAFVCALATATVFLLIAAFAFGAFGEDLAGKFSTEAQARGVAADILNAYCFVLPFMGYYVLIGMLMQNIGRFGQAALITTMENGLFLLPMVLVLPRVWGYRGLVWCKPAASACALLFSALIGIRAWRRYLRE
jgi:putative MATE family efflux protein